MTTPDIAAGTRNLTEIEGVFSVVGEIERRPGGWVRSDVIVIGSERIGIVQVQEYRGRISAISISGDRAVLGRDVAWVLLESGKSVPESVVRAPESLDRKTSSGRRPRP